VSSGTQPVDRVGSFRGKVQSYRAVEGKASSVSIALEVLVEDFWNGEEWENWSEYCMVAEGMVCVVKNDKTIAEIGVRGLIEAAGWDGSMMSIFQQTWEPAPISFTVEEDSYKGETRLRIGFINPFDQIPGRAAMTEEKAKAFDASYGPQLRAFKGNATRNATPPSGKPAKPPKANGGAPKKEKQPVLGEDGNPIPF
jgi:hypothetical protein